MSSTSSMYSSNEKKERRYVKENKIREINQEAQQQIVDDEIDKELGLDRKATNIGLLSKRIADRLATASSASSNKSTSSAMDGLLNAINNGKLTELFNKLKTLPDSVLSKAQRIIRDDLNNEENKKIVNELISEAIPNGPEAVKMAVLQSLGGVGDAAEARVLDMISLTQKVPESKSKAKQVLDTIGFTNKIPRAPKVKEPPKLANNLEILDNAIQFNKLSNLFKELKSIPDDYLNDTQKNIKFKLSDKESKEIINDLISNAVEKGKIKEINKIVLNELITKGNKKEEKDFNEMLNMTSSSKATSLMSDSPQKIDLRAFNKGKPKKDTNDELNEFSDLLIKYGNAPKGRKSVFNQKLKNIINRQKNVNPQIAERMLMMKNAIQ